MQQPSANQQKILDEMVASLTFSKAKRTTIYDDYDTNIILDEDGYFEEDNLLPSDTPSPDSLSSESATFSFANNIKRQTDVTVILNAVLQYRGDHDNLLDGLGAPLTTLPKMIGSPTFSTFCSSITPAYIASLPVDPLFNYAEDGISQSMCSESNKWGTGYAITLSENGKLTVSAPHAELGETISVTR